MRKVIQFGKPYKKLIEVEIELREDDLGRPELSVCAYMWRSMRKSNRGYIAGGQCLDTILDIIPEMRQDEQYMEIVDLWHKYHLNGMNAGTPEQTEAIKKWEAEGNRYDYKAVCEYLKEIGLYEVPLDKDAYPDVYAREAEKQETDKPVYRYGHAWLYRAIPEKDLNRIKEIIAN